MKSICLVLVVFICTLMHSASKAAGYYSGNFLLGDTTKPMVLPVHWFDFRAAQLEKSVLLNWSTLHEDGIKKYNIQRSISGNKFQDIGYVIANGNSSTLLKYEYEDKSPLPGNAYYRVTCEDENGYQSVSLIRKINFNDDLPELPLTLKKIYVTGKIIHFTPVFHNLEQSRVCIYTRSGRLALTAMINNYTNNLDASQLKGGIYYLNTGYETRSIIIGD